MIIPVQERSNIGAVFSCIVWRVKSSRSFIFAQPGTPGGGVGSTSEAHVPRVNIVLNRCDQP